MKPRYDLLSRCARHTVLMVALLALLAGSGCARRWHITLTNGSVIDAKGKPKLNKDKTAYYYTDSQGKPSVVSVTRVTQLEPK